MNKIVGHQKVHLLRGGYALCLFSKKEPTQWPPGNLWVREDEWSLSTCAKCLAKLREEALVKRLPEKAVILKTKILKLESLVVEWDPAQRRLLDMLAGWSHWCARDPHAKAEHASVVALYEKAGNLHLNPDGEWPIDVAFAIGNFVAHELSSVVLTGKLDEWQPPPPSEPNASPTTASTPRAPSGAKVRGKKSPTESSGKPKRASRR